MLNNSIIVIPCNTPWQWSTDYCNQTAKYLSKTNTVICFFWLNALSLKEILITKKRSAAFYTDLGDGILGYYMVHLLPFRRFQFITSLNIFINVFILLVSIFFMNMKKNYTKKILWFFDPITSTIVSKFPKNWIRIYDCVDYFRGDILLTKKQRASLVSNETKLIKESQIVVVNSKILYKMHSHLRKNIHIVPQGFRLKEFQKISKSSVIFPKDKPIIGYIGALNYRLDYKLLVSLAKKLTRYRFVFVGPVQENFTSLGKKSLNFAKKHLFSLPNVTVIYGVDKNEIKHIISQFNMGIIPYRTDMKFNTYSYPMKLFEYFYVGKPVVTTIIDELRHFPKFVSIGFSVESWEHHFVRLLSKPWQQTHKKMQKQLSKDNSWSNKIDTMIHIIESDQF